MSKIYRFTETTKRTWVTADSLTMAIDEFIRLNDSATLKDYEYETDQIGKVTVGIEENESRQIFVDNDGKMEPITLVALARIVGRGVMCQEAIELDAKVES